MRPTAMDCPGVNALEESVGSSLLQLSIVYMAWQATHSDTGWRREMCQTSNLARAAK